MSDRGDIKHLCCRCYKKWQGTMMVGGVLHLTQQCVIIDCALCYPLCLCPKLSSESNSLDPLDMVSSEESEVFSDTGSDESPETPGLFYNFTVYVYFPLSF